MPSTVRNIKAPEGDGNIFMSHVSSAASSLETSKPRKGTETYDEIERMRTCYFALETSKPRKGTETISPFYLKEYNLLVRNIKAPEGDGNTHWATSVLNLFYVVRNIKAPEGDGNSST